MRDVETIKNEIEKGIYPSTYAEDRQLLLKVENLGEITGNLVHYAAKYSGDSNLWIFLENIGGLEEGLKRELLDSVGGDGKNALMHAVSSKDAQRGIKFLLKNGVNLRSEDIYGYTALRLALSYENYEAARILLKNGGANKADSEGYTPLMRAIDRKNSEAVKIILKHSADLDLELEDINGKTALTLSLDAESFELATMLLQAGAVANKPDNMGLTPLTKAVLEGNVGIIKCLLENKADANQADNLGETPLSRALLKEDVAIIECLLKNGANVDQADNMGWTPLIRAVSGGKEEIVKCLLKNGANVDQADNMGWTPLIRAVLEGKEEIIKCLLENGANVDQADNMGLTPLTKAVLGGKEEIVKCLLENGANPNLVDLGRNTALHFAKDKAIIKLLLDHKADFAIINSQGSRALDLMPPEEELHKLLLKAFALFDTFNSTIKAKFEAFKEAQVVNTNNGQRENIGLPQTFQEAYKDKSEEDYRKIKDIIELMDATMESNHEKLNDSTEIFYSGYEGHFTCFVVKKVETGYIVIECNRGSGSETYGSGVNIFKLPASISYDTLVEKIKSIKTGDLTGYKNFIETLGKEEPPIHIERKTQAGGSCISESAKTLFEVWYALKTKNYLNNENITREEIEKAINSCRLQYQEILDQVKNYYFKEIFDRGLAAKPDSIDRENAVNFFLSVFITKVPEFKEHLSPFTIKALENLRELNVPGLVKKVLDEKAKTVDYFILTKVHQQMIAAVVDKIDRETTLRDNTEHTVADLETIGTPEVIGHLGGEDVGFETFA